MATMAAYCTGVMSKPLARSMNSAKDICCSRRMRWPGMSTRPSFAIWITLTLRRDYRYTDKYRQYADEFDSTGLATKREAEEQDAAGSRSDRCRQEASVHRSGVLGVITGRPRGLYLRRAG